MFNGYTMSLVVDLNILGDQIYNKDFLTIAAVTTSENYPDISNCYYAGILCPPVELFMSYTDGDQAALNVGYPQYLSTKDCDDFIVALIAALTRKNIIIYIPKDEYNIFGAILLNHIYYTYGIVVNSPTSQFYFNQHKIPFIISKFLLLDVMDAQTYLDLYPAQYMLPDFVINKLAEDIHPFEYPATFEQYREYFNKLNAAKIQNKPKIQMLEDINK